MPTDAENVLLAIDGHAGLADANWISEELGPDFPTERVLSLLHALIDAGLVEAKTGAFIGDTGTVVGYVLTDLGKERVRALKK